MVPSRFVIVAIGAWHLRQNGPSLPFVAALVSASFVWKSGSESAFECIDCCHSRMRLEWQLQFWAGANAVAGVLPKTTGRGAPRAEDAPTTIARIARAATPNMALVLVTTVLLAAFP